MVGFYDFFTDYDDVVSGLSGCIGTLIMHRPVYVLVPHDKRTLFKSLDNPFEAARRFVDYMDVIAHPGLYDAVAHYMLATHNLNHLVLASVGVAPIKVIIQPPPTRTESAPPLPVDPLSLGVQEDRPAMAHAATEPSLPVSPPPPYHHRPPAAPRSLHIVKRNSNRFSIQTDDGRPLYDFETVKSKGRPGVTRIVRCDPPPDEPGHPFVVLRGASLTPTIEYEDGTVKDQLDAVYMSTWGFKLEFFRDPLSGIEFQLERVTSTLIRLRRRDSATLLATFELISSGELYFNNVRAVIAFAPAALEAGFNNLWNPSALASEDEHPANPSNANRDPTGADKSHALPGGSKLVTPLLEQALVSYLIARSDISSSGTSDNWFL